MRGNVLIVIGLLVTALASTGFGAGHSAPKRSSGALIIFRGHID